MLSGWGVYCGFSLTIDTTTCSVCVGPGVAVDAKGRELVSDQSISHHPATPQDVNGRGPCDPCAKPTDEDLYLAIVYYDCLDSAKPKYGTGCGASQDPGCDFSRVREQARLVWVTDLDPSHFTTGRPADPRADLPTIPEGCLPSNEGCEQRRPPRMDECTPCIGIRGGAGVEMYARALDTRWSLSCNAALIEEDKKEACSCQGVATLIDVISGAACEACPGEAVVVLARVRCVGRGQRPDYWR